MAHTHMLRASSSANVLQHSTMSEHGGICLHCTHTCHTYHRTSRLHLSRHETGDPCPQSGVCGGGGGHGAVVTMQAGLADSNKSHLLRILHKKLRWRRINSRFGRAARKALFMSRTKSNQHDSCANTDVQYFTQTDDAANAEGRKTGNRLFHVARFHLRFQQKCQDGSGNED